MKRLRKMLSDESGNVMVMLAVGMVVFLGMAALVADVGLMYLTRQQLVNSADAAVLAGAQELPGSSAQAREIAEDYLLYNTDAETFEVNIKNGNTEIEVTAKKEVNFFFARVLGIESSQVSAVSRGVVGTISGHLGTAPLGISENDMKNIQIGDVQTLKVSDWEESELGSGEYGVLDLGGNFNENLKYGFSEMLRVGDTLDPYSGNKVAMKNSLDWRLSECNDPFCSPDNFERDCTKILIVPIYKPIAFGQNKVTEVEIVGFAAFYIEEVKQPPDLDIIGRFVRTMEPGEMELGYADYGVKTVKLTN